MATLYYASTYGDEVRKIEAVRVTEYSYFTLDHRGKERRNALDGTNFKAFTEKSAAIAWMREYLEGKISETRATLVFRVRKLDEFNEKYPQP